MKKLLLPLFFLPLLLFAQVPCNEALIRYAVQYPAAEPADLYKLVFQDQYGPGHLITDSLSCVHYIQKEIEQQCVNEITTFPLYEYTLCDSNFVRVNLYLVKWGVISLEQMVSAVMQLPIWIQNLSLAVGAGLILFWSAVNVFRDFYSIKTGKEVRL